MNKKTMGEFIKELREENNMSQTDLGKQLNVHRAYVSKWETGRTVVTPEYLTLLSEFFDVSIDELIAGKREKKDLSTKINDITLKLFDNNRKLHGTIKYGITIIFILLFVFLSYYFYSFYNTVKVYTIHLDSDKYIANYGLLTKTNDKIYFYLDIDYLVDDIESIDSVQLFYNMGNKVTTISEITDIRPFSFTAFNGYDEYINFDEFDKALDKMYIYVNFIDGNYERVQLKFDRDYANSSLLPKKNKKIKSDLSTTYSKKKSTKFYDRFLELKKIIDKHGKEGIMKYDFEGKKYRLEIVEDFLYISTEDSSKPYSICYSFFNAELFTLNFLTDNEKKQVYSFNLQRSICVEGDCTNHMDYYREMMRLFYGIVCEYK